MVQAIYLTPVLGAQDPCLAIWALPNIILAGTSLRHQLVNKCLFSESPPVCCLTSSNIRYPIGIPVFVQKKTWTKTAPKKKGRKSSRKPQKPPPTKGLLGEVSWSPRPPSSPPRISKVPLLLSRTAKPKQGTVTVQPMLHCKVTSKNS